MGPEVLEGQIDPVSSRVLGHVAQDVGQLKRNARLLSEFLRARVLVAEDADADQAHDRGHTVAVAVKVGERGIGVRRIARRRPQVHRDARHQLVQQAEGNGKPLRGIAHGQEDRVGGVPAPARIPPCRHPLLQAAESLLAGEALIVGQVVGPAHERIDGADGVAARHGQGDKGVVEVLRLALGDRPTCRVGPIQIGPAHCGSGRHAAFSFVRPPRRRKGSALLLKARNASPSFAPFERVGREASTS